MWSRIPGLKIIGPRNQKSSFYVPLTELFWRLYREHCELDVVSLRLLLPKTILATSSTTRNGLIYTILLQTFPEAFLRKLVNVKKFVLSASQRANRLTTAQETIRVSIEAEQGIINAWPHPIDEETCLERAKEYVQATSISAPAPCACCGQSFLSTKLPSEASYRFSFGDRIPPGHPLHCLKRKSTAWSPPAISHESLPNVLRDVWLFHDYVQVDATAKTVTITLCIECHRSLQSSRIPKFSLLNNLYRGELPPELRDITWIEEKVCALHRITADVARLHNAESNEKLPYRLVGNVCSHPVNVPSTARVLPRVPADVNGTITVVFVGPTFQKKQLPPMFRVRRSVILAFLRFLAANNPLYHDIEISDANLALYPEDDILPLLESSVIVNSTDHDSSILSQESASFEQHPTGSIDTTPDSLTHHKVPELSREPAIESTGVIDFQQTTISGHSAAASALFNLLTPPKPHTEPDLIIPRSSSFVNDYNNPFLFPGMFPTLFPFGMGGIEAERPTVISFQEHVNYLLKLHDPAFKHHRLFLFVALSIIKKRKAHLHTSFTVKRSSFLSTARMLSTVTAETLKSTAEHLQSDKPFSDMNLEQKMAMNCLKELNIISAHLPGSPAAKLQDRASMRGYFGLFGLPHVYLTLNPSAAHSPILQVFLGDTQVDLSQQYPSMPLPDVRAKRIARDPTAAADFFHFSIKMFLKHLLGYDPETGISTGGILGRVKAYYGKVECTMRGCLHGHFVIWLLGGLNPRQVHDRMSYDEDFKQRFFQFWEQIIKHDAPYEEYDVSSTVEPRTQRPPPLDSPNADAEFLYDVKQCAEKLQRHECRDVCWKYSEVKHIPRELRRCRFQFPHEVVQKSYYDEKTKSVVMSCRDPTMNYYNPYILSFCRHNHDIKNILSGTSAKAAMFYITNYITKDDLHSHHILSMMAAAMDYLREDSSAAEVDQAKARLHRWVAQLTRYQEIHAQMAVSYIRGYGDTICSHKTVPMLSRLLLSMVHSLFSQTLDEESYSITHATVLDELTPKDDAATDRVSDDDDDDNDECELGEKGVINDLSNSAAALRRTSDGQFFTDSNQIEDYLHRDTRLASLSFYEFVCCVRKEKGRLTNSAHLGAFERYSLLPDHPQYSTHILVQHQEPKLPLHRWKTPPRMIGMQVPRRNSQDYHVFMLAHFKPFSMTNPLIETGTYAAVFEQFEFPEFARTVMENWEDIHECEDQRDSERMKKRQNAAKDVVALNTTLSRGLPAENDEEYAPTVSQLPSSTGSVSNEIELVHKLTSAGWFKSDRVIGSNPSKIDEDQTCIQPSSSMISAWKASIKSQEENIRRQRNNMANSLTQLEYRTELTGESPQAILGSQFGPFQAAPPIYPDALPETVAAAIYPVETANQLIDRIGHEMTLNEQQWIAYLIVARKFVADLEAESSKQPKTPPLRLLLTGPGGTGKSHVVNTLKKLMDEYGMAYKLRLLAPTGSAASLIDGTTIHKGLGIKIKQRNPKNLNVDDAIVTISQKQRMALEADWQPTEWVFVDESSMISLSLNAELDQMLRAIKRRDEWYGGVNIVFAGDFSQYPPVRSTPLYKPLGPCGASQTNKAFLERLGRLAWLEVTDVVELTEQKRMANDPDYAAAVSRLRMRRCMPADVDLFNSRVVEFASNLGGVRLTPFESATATTIVRDNRTRLLLNHLKSKAVVSRERLIICAARDSTQDDVPLKGEEQDTHLKLDFASIVSQGALPSFIPLAVGVTVVLRNRNICSELKISNGSIGTLISLFVSDNGPYRCAEGAVVHFAASPIQLQGLPPGCVYIEPESKSYSLMQNGEKVTFRRRQLLIEPAFAVTGHFAQGKTLETVVADLSGGGPAAYVAASRPTTRKGLFLLNPIKLKDLNHPPLPAPLLKELDRFEALKHNTLVEYGFATGKKRPVPIEDHQQLPPKHKYAARLTKPTATAPSPGPTPVHLKRKREPSEAVPLQSAKRLRTLSPQKANATLVSGPEPNPLSTTNSLTYPFPHLQWDRANYSCAYDTVLTTLQAAWRTMSAHSRHLWRITSRNPTLDRILRGLSSITSDSGASNIRLLTPIREEVRNLLSDLDPRRFPRVGAIEISLDDVVCALGLDHRLVFERIEMCGTQRRTTNVQLAYMLYTASISRLSLQVADVVTVQRWIDAQLHLVADDVYHPQHSCSDNFKKTRLIDNPPPFLCFHSNPSTLVTLRPSDIINVPGITVDGPAYSYRLVSIMCHGNSHFTSWILQDEEWWHYDGMLRAAAPIPYPPQQRDETLHRIVASKPGLFVSHYLYILNA